MAEESTVDNPTAVYPNAPTGDASSEFDAEAPGGAYTRKQSVEAAGFALVIKGKPLGGGAVFYPPPLLSVDEEAPSLCTRRRPADSRTNTNNQLLT
jgi:hypothetical protein